MLSVAFRRGEKIGTGRQEVERREQLLSVFPSCYLSRERRKETKNYNMMYILKVPLRSESGLAESGSRAWPTCVIAAR